MINIIYVVNIYVNNNYFVILNVLFFVKLVKFFFLIGLIIGVIKKNWLNILYILFKGYVMILFFIKKDLVVRNILFVVYVKMIILE